MISGIIHGVLQESLDYVILTHSKQGVQHNHCDICVAHVANVGWNTFEYRTDFLYISDWLGIKETTRTSNLLELHDMAKEHKDLVTPCTLSTCTIHPTFVTS